jgi:cyanophycinase
VRAKIPSDRGPGSRYNSGEEAPMRSFVVGALLVLLSIVPAAAGKKYGYVRVGNPSNAYSPTTAGVVLTGGGYDVDEAFHWVCGRAGRGDFLILRAAGTDAYNAYVQQLCPGLNSVATLVVPTAAAAADPFVVATVKDAEAIWLAGGDQSNYVAWKGTGLQAELNEAIGRGVPVGGTSAGMMVLTQFVYSALGSQGITSSQALANPYNKYLTLDRDLAAIPELGGVVGDSHFVARDRMGRTLAFMARIAAAGWSYQPRAIGVDEQTALLIDDQWNVSVVGLGTAYFLQAPGPAEACRPSMPLTYTGVDVYRVWPGASFDLGRWDGHGGLAYQVSAIAGVMSSTLGDSLY